LAGAAVYPNEWRQVLFGDEEDLPPYVVLVTLGKCATAD